MVCPDCPETRDHLARMERTGRLAPQERREPMPNDPSAERDHAACPEMLDHRAHRVQLERTALWEHRDRLVCQVHQASKEPLAVMETPVTREESGRRARMPSTATARDGMGRRILVLLREVGEARAALEAMPVYEFTRELSIQTLHRAQPCHRGIKHSAAVLSYFIDQAKRAKAHFLTESMSS